jgi:hypothetical protein
MVPTDYRATQAEVLLAEFWDPSSGAVFSEEGDQQRFWKLTRRFVDGLAAGGAADAARIKVVRSHHQIAAATTSRRSGQNIRSLREWHSSLAALINFMLSAAINRAHALHLQQPGA